MPRGKKAIDKAVVDEVTEETSEEVLVGDDLPEDSPEDTPGEAAADTEEPGEETAPTTLKTDVNTLRQALEILAPVVPRKTALPVLTNICLRNGKALATDLDTAVIVDFPDADGACLLPARETSELLKHVAGFHPLTIEIRRRHVSLIWSDGKATFDVPKPDDYPLIEVPEVDESAQADLDGEDLVTALARALPYCATDEARPVLGGVSLHLGEKITVVGADGFRMSYQELDTAFPIESTAILPARSIKILEYIWRRLPPAVKPVDDLIAAITAKRLIRLGIASGTAVVWLPKVMLTSKLVQGTPPDFERLIPQKATNNVLIFASELERGLRRLKNIAKDNKDIVRLSWDDGKITLAAKGSEGGEMETTVPAMTDQPGKIALAVSYLLDYLKGKTDLVKLTTNSTNEPALLQYRQSHKVVIMPMNVQW